MFQQKSQRPCQLIIAGQVPYRQAWEWQRSLLHKRLQNPDLEDVLLLLEHLPVYTLGQGGDASFLKFDPAQTDAEVHRVERGGEVTYHCPGQLVGYPILNLRFYRQDLHWYLRQLEEVLIQAIATLGVTAERIAGLTGVWVDGYKVAAIGIKASRWVTMHGFALNVCPDLTGFQQIVPCGIADRPVGCLAQFTPSISVEQARTAVLESFAEQFGVEFLLQSEAAIAAIMN